MTKYHEFEPNAHRATVCVIEQVNPLYGYTYAFVLFLSACGRQTLDLGMDTDVSAERGGSGGADSTSVLETMPICTDPIVDAPNAIWPDAEACAAAATGTQSKHVGTWEGYSEDVMFRPIKKYRLELLVASPGGAVCGRLTFGEGTVPPLSNDPTAFYPPGTGLRDTATNYALGNTESYARFIDGATYTIVSGAIYDNELRFLVSKNEAYKGWCALQPSYHIEATHSYSCTPKKPLALVQVDDQFCLIAEDGLVIKQPIAQCNLCGDLGVCTCDSCHCTARTPDTEPPSFNFDLTFDGNEATATVFEQGDYHWATPTVPPVLLRLNRVQP